MNLSMYQVDLPEEDLIPSKISRGDALGDGEPVVLFTLREESIMYKSVSKTIKGLCKLKHMTLIIIDADGLLLGKIGRLGYRYDDTGDDLVVTGVVEIDDDHPCWGKNKQKKITFYPRFQITNPIHKHVSPEIYDIVAFFHGGHYDCPERSGSSE